MSTEKIIKIEETSFWHLGDWPAYEGIVITTDKQEIKIGIQSGQSCCETYGYFISEDNIQSFLGSNLLRITITDTALKNVRLELDIANFYEVATMFVDVQTSSGVLQFAAYNSHNGCYGHEALIVSQHLTHSETL